MHHIIKFLVFFLSTSSLLFYPGPIHAKTNWQDLSSKDLAAIHRYLLNDSSLCTKEHGFKSWCSRGYELALKEKSNANSFEGYDALIRFYVYGFKVPHLYIKSERNNIENDPKWPGFIVAYRNNSYQIISVADSKKEWKDLPPLGAKLIECNGMKPDELMLQNVTPFTNADPKHKSTWYPHVNELFVNTGNPFIAPVNQCVFDVKDHKIQFQLNWKSIALYGTDKFKKIADESTFGTPPSFSIHSFGKNSVWISIPTFSTVVESGNTAKKNTTAIAFFKTIASNLPQYRNKDAIVFDVRGNGGGDQPYEATLLVPLYGTSFLNSLGMNFIDNKPRIDHIRVSKDNLAYLKKVHAPISILNGIEDGLSQNKSYVPYQENNFRNPFQDATDIEKNNLTATNKKRVENPVKAQIILLTDGRCASMCWEFIRAFRELPNVIQVGQPTAVADQYGLVRFTDLPSKMSVLHFPIDIIISPSDHYGNPFNPHYYYDNFMGDTEAIKNWMKNLK